MTNGAAEAGQRGRPRGPVRGGAQVLGLPTTPRDAERVRPGRTSHGDKIVLLMTALVPAGALASRILDQAALRRDVLGYAFWYTEGNRAFLVSAGFLVAAALTAAWALVVAERRSVPRTLLPGLVLLGWYLVVAAVRPDGLSRVLQLMVLMLLFAGVVASPPTRQGMRWLAALLTLICVTAWTYALLIPQEGFITCRSDGKCGFSGRLLLGYFPQENYLGILACLLLPCVVFLHHRLNRWLVAGLTVGTVFATGSRGAVVALIAAGCAMVVFLRAERLTGHLAPPVAMRVVPLVGLGLSLVVFLTVGGNGLTGRGQVYDALKQHFDGVGLLLGPGPDTLRDAARQGLTRGFAAFHEHGEAPHLLTRVGIPGLILFAALLASIALHRRWNRQQFFALVMASPVALLYSTESVWKLEWRDASLWSLLLFVGLFAEPPEVEVAVPLTPSAQKDY